MPLSLSLNPNLGTWSIGDPLIALSFSGGNSAQGNAFLWESDNGTFNNKFSATPIFTPNNATKVTTITARRVWHNNYTGNTNITASGTYGVSKNSSSNTWNSYVRLATSSANEAFGLVEFEATQTNTERAGGFLNSLTYADPTVTNANINLTFSYNFHLYADGTAVARKGGTLLTVPITYKTGDIFKIVLETSKVTYYLNNLVVVSVSRLSGGVMYPALSFKTPQASLNGWSYQQVLDNSGATTLNVVGVLPINPNYSYELTNDNITSSSVAEDGSLYFRKRGNAKKGFSLSFNQRPFTEYQAIAKFWSAHERQEKFIYRDIPNNQNFLVRFESGLQTTVESPDVITIQASLKEI